MDLTGQWDEEWSTTVGTAGKSGVAFRAIHVFPTAASGCESVLNKLEA